jgi:hypothetical protein
VPYPTGPTGGPGGFGVPPQAPQPAPRRSGGTARWLIPVLVIVGLIVLLIGGCSFLVFTSTRPAVDATNTYLATIDDGDYQQAYESLCSRTRSNLTDAQWVEQLEGQLRGGDITGYSYLTVNVTNNRLATVSGTIDIDGFSRTSNIQLVNEDGAWRVCSPSPLG